MRLARLDLARFGKFADTRIDLPAGRPDLHVVCGPNEAGKTTAMVAIEDLLFGVPARSPYDFLHGYNAMRIGAVIEGAAGRLEFRRRKGNKDTVLGPDDLPLADGEGRLAAFLGGADRAFFARMFNLDHERLAEGGRAILEAEGDAGSTLFAAATGLSGIRESLENLEREADDLWARRRSKDRLYYRASDRLDDAKARLRENTLRADDWANARRALDNAEKESRGLQGEREAVSADLRRLNRIRRVYPVVRRVEELEREISGLAGAPDLPESASATLEKARHGETEAAARIEALAGRLRGLEAELETLAFDEALVARAEDIRHLDEKRIEVRKERADLPKRREELAAALAELAGHARDLGWDAAAPEDAIGRIPPRDKVAGARALLARRGGLATALEAAAKAREEARRVSADSGERLAGIAEAVDVSGLSALLETTPGDLDSRVEAAARSAEDAARERERLRRSLGPALPDTVDPAGLPVPPRDTVGDLRDRLRHCRERREDNARRLDEAERALERDRQGLERRIADEGVETATALRDARARRDDLWTVVRLRHIDDAPVPEDLERRYDAQLGDPVGAFEEAGRAADAIADRRFDKAEAAGRLAELSRTVEEGAVAVEELRARRASLETERNRLDMEWSALWRGLPVEAGPPDAMLEWLDAREVLIAAMETRRREAARLAGAERAREEARGRLLAALGTLGLDANAMAGDTLAALLSRARKAEQDAKALAREREVAREAVRAAKDDLRRREAALETAGNAWAEWEREWAAAWDDLGLGPATEAEASARLDSIELAREAATRAEELRRRRIGAIERDIEAFRRLVAETATELAPDLAGAEPDEATLALARRLDEARELRDRRADRVAEAGKLRAEIGGLELGRREAAAVLRPLKEAAGAEDNAALAAAIERSDRRRALERELAGALERLRRDGDGLPVADLALECQDAEFDRLPALVAAAEERSGDLQARLDEAAARRAGAEQAFRAMGGGDAAARAEAARQEAIAALRAVAERYVRARTSALLLRWAIDRHRRERQGPMLRRAGALFRTLTGDSFERLEVRYDDKDRPRLAGLRPDEEEVAVAGMSGGTEDQLYLALRIAALEAHVEAGGAALPFVADDLFVAFDPDRSAAGFEILGRLAERTQVLFFTHHPHLVDLARDALGADTHVVGLV